MKYARKRDANEKDIVRALEAAGASVTRLGDPGVPDLLVGYQGATFLLEVKLPLEDRAAAGGRRESQGGRGDLTKAQVAWWDSWRGAKAHVVRSVDEALVAIGARGTRLASR